MKVIKSVDNLLIFDNGLEIVGDGDVDCCAYNYLDFEQFVVGAEFPDMTDKQAIENMRLKDDGFALTDSQGLPKWCQARSEQNGYYSNMTYLGTYYLGIKTKVAELDGGDMTSSRTYYGLNNLMSDKTKERLAYCHIEAINGVQGLGGVGL